MPTGILQVFSAEAHHFRLFPGYFKWSWTGLLNDLSANRKTLWHHFSRFLPRTWNIWDRSNWIKASLKNKLSFTLKLSVLTGGMLLTYGSWALTHSNLQILAKMSVSWDCVWYACASLVGPSEHSVNAIVGTNEWIKGS